MSSVEFWNAPETAKETIQTLKSLNAIVDPLVEISRLNRDLHTHVELLQEHDDITLESEFNSSLCKLQSLIDDAENFLFFADEISHRNCYFNIQSGAGGVDACDWAAKLLRMYLKYFRTKDYEVEELDLRPGTGGGIQSCNLMVKGSLVYGRLLCEAGVHRVIRISAFNSKDKRETSFASVDVQPEVDEIDIQVDWDEDVREDTYRSSGPGGQNVNKTSSAVRLTHIETNIVVQCQNERSQHKNRDRARKMMMSKLYELEQTKRDELSSQAYAARGVIGFGNAIRSYFVHPQQRVKDDRTNIVRHDLDAILDGDLDEFIEAELRRKYATSS